MLRPCFNGKYIHSEFNSKLVEYCPLNMMVWNRYIHIYSIPIIIINNIFKYPFNSVIYILLCFLVLNEVSNWNIYLVKYAKGMKLFQCVSNIHITNMTIITFRCFPSITTQSKIYKFLVKDIGRSKIINF